MTKHLSFGCLASIGALVGACSGSSAVVDAGTDAPILVVPDAGPPDAGPHDGGDGTCGDNRAFPPSHWPPIPDTCLPLCSAETAAAITACGSDTDCIRAAFAADSSPPVTVRTYAGPITVSCSGEGVRLRCEQWQLYSCLAEHCEAEYDTFARCTTESCAMEMFMAADACCMASGACTNCAIARIGDCLPR